MLGGAVNSPVIGSRVTVELHRAAVARVAVGSNVPLPSSVDGLKPANLSAFSLAMVLCTVTYGSAAGRLMNDLVRRSHYDKRQGGGTLSGMGPKGKEI